jgi:outer membrane lipopolysaccharide assembly protein LptE/RlpB
VGWLVLLALSHGCGYSIVRTGGSLGDVRSVAIQTPRNDSWEPGAEYVVADALRREFLRRKGVRVVENPSSADLVLGGRVSRLDTRTASVDSVVLVIEYEITLELELEARRSGGAAVPLDLGALRDSERYLASADAEVTRKNRQEALRQVASVLAGRIYLALQETLETDGAAPAGPPGPAAPG